MDERYDQRAVSRLIGISETQIRYWNKTGLIPHVGKERGLLLFDFKGLVAFRTLKELRQKGLSNRSIVKCIEKLKTVMPQIDHPLTELRVTVHGKKVVFGKDSLRFTPEGQLLMDFGQNSRKPSLLPVASEELFFQALTCEAEGRFEEARKKYKTILKQRSDADVLVNLGNIEHKLGSCKEAEECYRRALRIDPDHVEANHNLGNMLEERGDNSNAILFYVKAIHEDPEFAEAYFNLGRVLERIGEIEEAKEQWWAYLDLDASSEWADYVRSRLY